MRLGVLCFARLRSRTEGSFDFLVSLGRCRFGRSTAKHDAGPKMRTQSVTRIEHSDRIAVERCALTWV